MAWNAKRFYAKFVGGKASSILPGGDTDNYYTTSGWPEPSCLRKFLELPNCVLLINAGGFKQAQMTKHLKSCGHWGNTCKTEILCSFLWTRNSFSAEKSVYEWHVKPQFMCSQQNNLETDTGLIVCMSCSVNRLLLLIGLFMATNTHQWAHDSSARLKKS